MRFSHHPSLSLFSTTAANPPNACGAANRAYVSGKDIWRFAQGSTTLEMTMTAQIPADLARHSYRKDRRTHPISDTKHGLLRYALAALRSACHDTKNFEVARYTRFRGDVDEDLDHQLSWRFGVPVR